jgi:class 3 adenylate cyclase/tetratricopeptide (TPR) repeat protein
MSTAHQEQIAHIKHTISTLEARRSELGDALVDTSLQSLQKQLVVLESQPVSTAQQRKLATILYADVVGSTNLSQHLEPDEVLEIMDRALTDLAEPVEAHGGHVTRFQGDGFKAVFGLPVAHENDPEQAVRAGLQILEVAQEVAQDWQEQLGIPNFQVRVGINTGMVAAGGETEAEDTVMGRAVNLAARLESAAPPGGLLISHHTYRHVRGIFNAEAHEPLQAKGFEEPVAVYLVRSAKPRALHVLTRGVEGVETRMVGRETELKYLQDALLTAIEESEGQLVTVVGEAGVGKSRLIYEFQNWCELLPQAIRLYQGQAKLETQHIPYSLLRDLFAYRFQIQDSDPLEALRRKFEQGIMPAFESHPIPLDQDEFPDQAQVHLLGQLLGFDFSHSPHLKGFLQDSQALHNRGLIALETYFKALCRQGVVVILLEDIHWTDESSLDAIRRLARLTPDLPLLIVCLAREQLFEQRPYWGEGEPYHRKISLEPLSKRESRKLVSEILQFVDQVPLELRELLVSGAEGNPFYLEELVKMLIEQGVILTGEFDSLGIERWHVATDKLAQVELPTTLAGVLQARLDSLAVAEKRILQQAAVVGRTFWDQLLAHLYSHDNGIQDGRELADVFQVLRGKELIFRHEESAISGAVEYTFKHDLLREVVYETVLVKERKRYHGLVADWLQENSGERLGENYGLIGEHLERAGRVKRAIQSYKQAGEHALNTYANQEAESYYRRALALGTGGILKTQLLTDLGRSVVRQWRYDEALNYWKQSLKDFQELGDRDGVIQVYTLAIKCSFPYHPKEGLQLSREGLPFIEGYPENLTLGHFFNQVSRANSVSGLNDEAKRYCQRALEIGELFDDVELYADAVTTFGILVDTPFDEKVKALGKALELGEAHNLLYIQARAAFNLGVIISGGDNQDIEFVRGAKPYLTKAIKSFRKRADQENELYSLVALAYYHIKVGELNNAGELFKQIDFILNSTSQMDAFRASTGVTKASYFINKGYLKDALNTARFALKILRTLGYSRYHYNVVLDTLIPILRINEKFFFGKPGWSEVEKEINDIIAQMEAEGISHNQDLNYCCILSKINTWQGRFEQGEYWLSKAQNLVSESLLFYERLALYQAELEMARARKDWHQLMETFTSLQELIASGGDRWAVAINKLDWGDAYVARGKPGDRKQAEQLYRRSLAIFNEIGADGYLEVVESRLDSLENDPT